MIEAVGISRDWREPEERKTKQCPECEGGGVTYYSYCCGIKMHSYDFNEVDYSTCPKCRKYIYKGSCAEKCVCSGTGQVEDTSDEFDRADDNRD